MISFYSTADEIVESGTGTVVLPVGSTEQHGPHLPTSTDYLIASDVGAEIAKKLGAYLLPTLPISTCREHMGKKGSVWMKPDTFYKMIEDIAGSLKSQGFKKLVLVIAHGGIFIAGPVVREVNAVNDDFNIIRVDLVQFIASPEMSAVLECRDNLHACEFETSLLLYKHPELVRKDRIEDSLPGVPRDYLNYGSIFRYSKNGVWGRPSLATEEKGRKIFDILVDKSVQYVEDVSKILDSNDGYAPAP